MPDTPAISVVVPLYNEEDNVAELQQEIDTALTGLDYELVLVDDGSSDATVSRVVRGPRVRLIEFRKNAGQSAAMYAGIHAAQGKVIVTLDGDLQNDPKDIPALVALLDAGADLACGYRAKRKDTAFKRMQSRIANRVRSWFIGDGVRDTGCTLKAMKSECRTALVLFKRHAPLHPRAHRCQWVQSHRDARQSSPPRGRRQQIRLRQPRPPRHHGHVRRPLAQQPPCWVCGEVKGSRKVDEELTQPVFPTLPFPLVPSIVPR